MTDRAPLTDRQLEVYVYLIEFTREHFYQPSCKDIADHFGWRSPNAAQEHLRALQRKGWVRLTGEARAVEILHRVVTAERTP